MSSNTKQGIPGILVVLLSGFTFLLGRLMTAPAQLPDVEESVPVIGTARVLHEQQQPPKIRPPAIDALNPQQLERHMLETSGLAKVRPPITPGQSGDDFLQAVPFQILSWFPRIVVFPAFLEKAKCEKVIAMATSRLYPSGLAYRPDEKPENSQQTRTSKGTFISSREDSNGILKWVEKRIAAVTHIPVENGEAFNVLQYQNLQHYDSHMDSFDPKDFGPQPSQRIATVLVYLSDVEEGGETVFKKEGLYGDQKVITDWRNCDDGSFKYKPRQGDAVLFYSVDPNGSINPRALHGGCPVKNGTKWVMTKWLRDKGSRTDL